MATLGFYARDKFGFFFFFKPTDELFHRSIKKKKIKLDMSIFRLVLLDLVCLTYGLSCGAESVNMQVLYSLSSHLF